MAVNRGRKKKRRGEGEGKNRANKGRENRRLIKVVPSQSGDKEGQCTFEEGGKKNRKKEKFCAL